MFERDLKETMSSNLDNYSTLNNERMNREDLCIQSRNPKHALPITVTESGEV